MVGSKPLFHFGKPRCNGRFLQDSLDLRSLDYQTAPSGAATSTADPALQGLIGVDAVRQSGRLAGVAGGVLLILTALVGWLGLEANRLDVVWLTWAALPALLSTIGGPLLGRQRLSRGVVNRGRLVLLVIMIASSSAWVYASAVAVADQPVLVGLLATAWLALSVALVPSLAWLPGLALQLLVQLSLTVAFSVIHASDFAYQLLPLGLWISLAFLAMMAGLRARRVSRLKGDLHYLRYENAELQKRLEGSRGRLDEAAAARRTLEAELAEILNLAEDASRAKTEFLATMSHEIRTPLNGILPILEMLQETTLDREQQRLVKTAKGSSRHLLRIINDILDFAKVESGKLQLEAIEIDVRELVASVSELMRGSARNQNLKLSVRIADNVPEVVRGDPIRLRQVLINLVSNAIKFTEEGGIRIEVSRGQTSQKEVELLFAVADTGIGMSQETSDRLFQLFTQADASTTRKHGGTGLGLVICKRLVELMGGKIGVRSAVGQGSTFWFLVPLRRSVTEVPSARRDLKGVRVLCLIQDEATAARVADDLSDWGVTQEVSGDPQEALAVLRSTSMLGDTWGFQLVLIDGNGFEGRLPNLLREIRAIEALRKLRIVVALRAETLAQKLKRDYNVYMLTDELRPEPLRRLLHRLFDVESRHYGGQELRPDEIYDDMNLLAAEIAPVEDEPPPATDDGDRRVLLVEDNPVNQGVVSKALALLGVRCETAENGKQAVERCRLEDFDLIFMDCQMPVMDGYAATAAIREAEQASGLRTKPIVAMTANAMAGDREKCLAAGMDDYLAKPVSIHQLKRCIGRWLPSSLGPDTAAAAPIEGLPATANTAPSEQVPVLDGKVLVELRDIMQDDYLGLLKTFLRNAPELLEEARQAAAAGSADALVIPLHSLKSSSANVGAMALSRLARDGEKLARDGDVARAMQSLEQVEKGFAAAQRALREHISEQQPAGRLQSVSDA
jgi:signal transduction histidine kinase/DNA-binding NarL/FixJ family response regulator/HPt (histidine-containing phosphotransfer) domain-containing protein